MSKIFSNLFSRRSNSNKLQTDAGIIPQQQQQNDQQVDEYDVEQVDEENQSQCEYLRNNSQMSDDSSIPPLKQHILAVEEISQRNHQIFEYPGNNNLIGTTPNTVNNTVFQFSHIQGLHIGSVINNSQTSISSENLQKNGKRRIRTGGEVLKKTRTIDGKLFFFF